MTVEEARADLMLAQADVFYRPKDDSIDMAIKALENKKFFIEELEKLKAEIKEYYWLLDYYGNVITQNNVEGIIDDYISEMKGENK